MHQLEQNGLITKICQFQQEAALRLVYCFCLPMLWAAELSSPQAADIYIHHRDTHIHSATNGDVFNYDLGRQDDELVFMLPWLNKSRGVTEMAIYCAIWTVE